MQRAGLSVRLDDMANVIGHYHASDEAPTLVFGSHQDTVRQGGRFDGMLGIILPIVCLQALHDQGVNLPYNVDIIAFGDEEGVRFDTSYLCSYAISNQFDMALLDKVDQQGISMRDALKAFSLNPDNIAKVGYSTPPKAYIEVHIEQGPVLEKAQLPVGVVTAINGSSRYRISLTGMAGHAGTVPMAYRQDAGAGAANCISVIEETIKQYEDAVATIGSIEFEPGAINVIPGKATFTMDLRAAKKDVMVAAYDDIEAKLANIAKERGLQFHIEKLFFSEPCECDANLIQQIHNSVQATGVEPFHLPSGAGHDAQAMRAMTPVGMLFVRCEGGVSHNPAENISASDAAIAAEVICHLLQHAKL